MSFFCCDCKCRCPIVAIIISILAGVVTAFLQITGTITVTPVFLWVALGVALVYLGVLVLASALSGGNHGCDCLCAALNTLLTGIVGTVALAVLLLAIGIVATSVLSAILVGFLLLFFFLVVTATACLVRSLSDCRC